MAGAEGSTLRERLASFSIASGGASFRVLEACHLGGMARAGVARRCVVLAALAWVPLLFATVAEGSTFGGPGSFAWDAATHVRLLLALPLLLVAERAVDRRFRGGLAHLAESALVSDEHAERVDRLLARARRALDSRVADLVIVAGVTALAVNDVVRAPVAPHWSFSAGVAGALPTPTLAGWIDLVLSAPLYRLLVLRWVWRWAVWAFLLAGLARANLRLSALHVDEVGGLSVLADAHTSFGWILAAFGATLAGNFSVQRVLLQGTVADYTHTIAVFCFAAPILCLAPMFAFAWPLELARRRAHRDYAVAAADFARRYGRAHLDREQPVPIALESSDPSTAEDLGGSFERVLATRLLPVARKHFVFLFACALVPMIPFYLQELPMTEILERLRGVLG